MEQKLIKAINIAIEYITALAQQRDSAKSQILAKLLDDEIRACLILESSFINYAALQCNKMKADAEEAGKYVSKAIDFSKAHPGSDDAFTLFEYTAKYHSIREELMELDNFIFDQSIDLFVAAIKRDKGSWNQFNDISKKLAGMAWNAAGLHPAVGNLQLLAGMVQNIFDIANTLAQPEIAYSALDAADEKMHLIETHTRIIQEVAGVFAHFADLLSKPQEEI